MEVSGNKKRKLHTSSVGKTRKVDSENRAFQEEWRIKYFFIQSEKEALCLICNKRIAVLKAFNIERHYNTNHAEKFDKYTNAARLGKVEALQKSIIQQQNIFKKGSDDNASLVVVSYKVSHLIAQAGKPFSEGDLVKKCMITAVQDLCPVEIKKFEKVSLSRQTVTRRVEDISENLKNQMKSKFKNQFFSIALDESTDIGDTAQLLIFVRTVNENFDEIEELASLKSLHSTKKGKDVFDMLKKTIEENELEWKNLLCVTTDGEPVMTGKGNGLVGLITRHMETLKLPNPIFLHCIIHQEVLCSKVLKMNEVMIFVSKTINFIRQHGLNHREFQTFLVETEAEYGDVLYYTDVRWLSRGKTLARFLALKSEIEIFMVDRGKSAPELSDENWLWDLTFLTDITEHLNDLNVNLQGKRKLVTNVYSAVKAFELKLRLFKKQVESNNFAHFKSCSRMRSELKVPFNNTKYAGLIQLLCDSFEKRLIDFRGHDFNFKLLENPFSIEIDQSPEELQLELIELQCSEKIREELRSCKSLIDFYKSLSSTDYPNIRVFARKIASYFGSTYICEETFSNMKNVKSKLTSRLDDEHLHDILRIQTTSLVPDFKTLAEMKQSHPSH